jgi:hypothetical protein
LRELRHAREAAGGFLGGREFGLGLDLVHDAFIGGAVGEVFDDRVARLRNAAGAKFVREFASADSSRRS